MTDTAGPAARLQSDGGPGPGRANRVRADDAWAVTKTAVGLRAGVSAGLAGLGVKQVRGLL